MSTETGEEAGRGGRILRRLRSMSVRKKSRSFVRIRRSDSFGGKGMDRVDPNLVGDLPDSHLEKAIFLLP